MITDILSSSAAGGCPPQLPHGLTLSPRVPSPHGESTSFSDTGSYKENDISDDGEGQNHYTYLYQIFFQSMSEQFLCLDNVLKRWATEQLH